MSVVATNSRKRDWCFTIHAGHLGDKTEAEVETILKQLVPDGNAEYVVYQLEKGEGTERDHIQGYVCFKNAKAMNAVKKFLGGDAHLEPRRAPKISDAVAYCKKDDTRRPGTMWFEAGVQPMDNGVKRTLTEACELTKTKGVKRVALEMPEQYVRYHKGLSALEHVHLGESLPQQRPVKVFYLWGDSGCGKSHWAENYSKDLYSTGDMEGKIWFGDYTGQKTLVIEEFEGLCAPSIMKRMLDGYKMEVQTKGGFVWCQWDTVIVTSNYPPESHYDQTKNWFSVPPTAPGPFQRRFETGGIYHGTGSYDMDPASVKFDPPLPEHVEEVVEAEGDVEERDELRTMFPQDYEEPEGAVELEGAGGAFIDDRDMDAIDALLGVNGHVHTLEESDQENPDEYANDMHAMWPLLADMF